ncbi:MAG: rhodanese-like domain-containing protein, partial [Azoarcus sp.]|nr:rhodanese-like domain-containing protein [Azoarcus sp.]
EYRKTRLLKLDDFLARAKKPNTIILDSRSAKMYALKHLKGAVHLDFSDYTQETLFRLIPDWNTTILIYCNNNFLDDQQAFPSKMAVQPVSLGGEKIHPTLALNIPTFINLYGYGYRNVYELADLVSVDDPRLQFAGSEVR